LPLIRHGEQSEGKELTIRAAEQKRPRLTHAMGKPGTAATGSGNFTVNARERLETPGSYARRRSEAILSTVARSFGETLSERSETV